MTMRFYGWVVWGVVISTLAGCGGGGGDTAGNGAATASDAASVSSPTTVGISTASTRILLRIQAVGTAAPATPIPVDLDTGSSGVVLNALDIFPPSIANAGGFIFPAGQTTLQYNGITITNLQATKSFGGSGSAGTVFSGNLGFATIKFGEHGELTTRNSPILFYTSAADKNGNAKNFDAAGIFGVNSGADVIAANGAPAPTVLSVCTLQSSSTCNLVSPFWYLDYAPGMHAGFVLNPVTLNTACNVNTWVGCTSAQLLTVGLRPSTEVGFSLNALACPGNQAAGIDVSSGISVSVCQPEILTTVAVAGQSFLAFALFDSGTVGNLINVPAANSIGFPSPVAQGTTVSVTMLSGFVYGYDVGAAGTPTNSQFTLNTTQRNVFGVNLSTSHAFFIDFINQTEGFK